MHTRRLPVTLTLIALLLVSLLGGLSPVAAAGTSDSGVQQAAAPSAAAITPGNVLAWGSNDCGQLGDGVGSIPQYYCNSSCLRAGTSVQGQAVHAACKEAIVAAPTAADYNGHPVPTLVVNIGQIVAIAGGYQHSLALNAAGQVYGWGRNDYGQVGSGDVNGPSTYNYPVPVAAACPSPAPTPSPAPGGCGLLSDVIALAAGDYHSLALKSDGTVWAWGRNIEGQLGNGQTNGVNNRPQQVSLTGTIVAIAAGEAQGFALTSTGTVFAWGYNADGEVGSGTITNAGCNCISTPTQVIGSVGSGQQFLTGITGIYSGADSYHTFALKSDGTVLGWGRNDSGSLGDGTLNNTATPVQILGSCDTDPVLVEGNPQPVPATGCDYLKDVKQLAAGVENSIALLNDGSVYAWGRGDLGALGNGTQNSISRPTRVLNTDGTPFGGIAQVTAGNDFNLALTTNGRVYSWGRGDSGQVGDGLSTYATYNPVMVRSANGPGQLGGIVQIAAGSFHSLAIASATATPSANSVAFGSQPVGTVGTVQNVTITNNGGGPLSVTGVTITGTNAGDFNLVGGCSAVVAAGSSCTVGVAFAPTAVGARAGTLSFATNAGQTDVPLTGTGTVAAPNTFTVTASVVGQGSITPVGVTSYLGGTKATYTAVPAAGQVFLGWTLDGTYVGYPTPFDFTVNANRTLVATFAARPAFSDVPTTDGDWQAITFLAAFGIVNPQGVNGSGQFQPARAVVRAEVAAFIARTFGWDKEFHRNNFPDRCDPQSQNCVDNALWDNVAALADYGVVGGYTDAATCASAGTTAPCYLPRDTVIKLQVVSIVARAFTKTPDLRPTGFWDRLAAVAGQYTNVPDAGTQRSDLATYRANAGAIPGQASDATFPAPFDAASRRFVVATLYQAFNAVYSVDRTP